MGKYRSEWKYSISISHATQIRERLEAVLERDVHAKENGKYEIHSMYFDDFQNTCARENVAGDGIRYKYRIRYYDNDSENLFLEKKSKNNSYCYKQSYKLTFEQYNKILDDDVGDMLWEENKLFREFCLAILTKGFRPKVIVNYEREAFVEPISNVRITFDSNISASDEFDRFVTGEYYRVPIIDKHLNILEVKFDDVLSAHIRKLIQVEKVNQRSFSKYYMSRISIQDFSECI